MTNNQLHHKLKFCIVCPADFIGGAELFVADIANKILQDFSDIELYIITSDNKKFTAMLPSVAVRTMDFPRLKKKSLSAIRDFFYTAKVLHEKVEEIRPDVVMTNSIRAHLLGAQALKKSKVPLSFFVHDFTFPGIFFRWAQKKAQKIFTCSHAVKNDLLRKGGNPDSICVIHNGVDMEKFQMEEKIEHLVVSQSKEIYIGIIGRIDTWKGQDIFIKAAEEILRRKSQSKSFLLGSDWGMNFNFLIFGESSEHDKATADFEKNLKDEVNRKNLGAKIKFCGFTPATEALRRIDILVHASTQDEPFGRVVIEAMAVGVPVIASDTGGVVEIVQDGYNGFLIAARDTEMLTEKIITLAHDKNLREKFIINGYMTVRSKFDLRKITGELLEEIVSMKHESGHVVAE